MNFNPLDPFAKKKAPDKSWDEVFRKPTGGGGGGKRRSETAANKRIVINELPRVAMGTDFRFFAGIGNGGSQDLMIEDPKGTQLILIHVLSPEDTTENFFLLNPSNVDPVGEVTAPPHEEIPVKPGTYATFRFSLFKTMMDRCLAEGLFKVSFSYGDSRSKPVTLISVFAPA